ncbi:MAG: hypothetical protein R3C01_01400 [Planctomycetaceae bacterium]
MSVTHYDGTKVILPRTGMNDFWGAVQSTYAGENPLRWKYLAMLALRENAGWPLERIGKVFGHPKGHITRCLRSIKGDLKRHFRPPADENEDEQEFA